MIKIIQDFFENIAYRDEPLKNADQHSLEMSISEHLEELRQRIFLVIAFFLLVSIVCFLYIRKVTAILQAPAVGIKFLQLAPGEYFFASIKISVFAGLLISSPFIMLQIFLFIEPGLTKKEKTVLSPVLLSSNLLFFSGIVFGYFVLEPAALNFLIHYGDTIIEPIWSFEQYFDFTLTLLLSTGVVFQIPIIQIMLGTSQIVSSKQMFSVWRYIILLSTIISAVLTPSTDPLTQIVLSMALLTLYFSGAIFLFSINK